MFVVTERVILWQVDVLDLLWNSNVSYVDYLLWTGGCEVNSVEQKLSLSVEAVLYSTLHEALDSYREQDIAAGESSTVIVR